MTDETTGVVDREETTDAAQTDGGTAADPEADAVAGAAPLEQDLAGAVNDKANLDLLLDVNLKVTVELGRASCKFRDVLNLTTGNIVELDKQTSDPVDVLVNGALFATGEVVVIDDHFAVRITKLLNRIERLKRVP